MSDFYDLFADAWRERAACRSLDPEMFFPERGDDTREALAVCASCPVRTECLDYAVTNGEIRGIWGGLSARQRKAARPRRPAPVCGTRSAYERHHRLGEEPCDACRAANSAYKARVS